jgi:hypothetical protein
MARPANNTVDYFPFYVKDGDTLFILENQFGCEGLGFFTGVLRFLAQTPNHHYCIQEPVKCMRLFAKLHVEESKGMQMLTLMSQTGKIDRQLWDKCKVIASEDFLNSIKDAYKRRNNDIIKIEEIRQLYGLCSTQTELMPSETELMSQNNDANTQSKVKKRKVNKSKEESSEPDDSLAEENEPAKPPVPAKKDSDLELYNSIHKAFLSRNGDRFTNYGKEGKAIKEIIKKARIRSPDAYDDLIRQMMEKLWELKSSGDRFWSKQPFLPSSLNAAGIWDRVLEEFRDAAVAADNTERWIQEAEGERKRIYG